MPSDQASPSAGDDAEDRRLLAEAAQGRKEALKRLYFKHAPALERMIGLWSGLPSDAADVAQETFLAVWRNAGRFEHRSTVKTWIFSIARNKALDRRRAAGREAPLEIDENAPDLGAPDAQALMESASDAQRVRDCVAALGPAHRRAIEMAFYEGLEYKDIAEIEAAPLGTIKTRIFHAKQKLLQCLGAFMRG